MRKVKVSDKAKLKKQLLEVKSSLKELELSPDNLLAQLNLLGVTVTVEDVYSFIASRFSKETKHRNLEVPNYCVDAVKQQLTLAYTDETIITLYLLANKVKYCSSTGLIVWGDLTSSSLLPRILRDMPI